MKICIIKLKGFLEELEKVENYFDGDSLKSFDFRKGIENIERTLNLILKTKANEFFLEIKTIVLAKIEKEMIKVSEMVEKLSESWRMYFFKLFDLLGSLV